MDHLLIIVLIALTFGKVQSSVELISSNSTYSVNDSLTLTCSYKGNSTVQYFAWVFQQRVIDLVHSDSCKSQNINITIEVFLNYEFTCPTKNSNSMVIKRVPYLHSKGIACIVYTDERKIQSNTVDFTVQVPITYVRMDKPKSLVLMVKESVEVQFVCSTSFGFPAGEVRWYKDSGTPSNYTDDEEIKDNVSDSVRGELESASVVSVLKYFPNPADNGVSIYCKANNTVGQAPLVSEKKPILIIQHVPNTPDVPKLSTETASKTSVSEYNATYTRDTSGKSVIVSSSTENSATETSTERARSTFRIANKTSFTVNTISNPVAAPVKNSTQAPFRTNMTPQSTIPSTLDIEGTSISKESTNTPTNISGTTLDTATDTNFTVYVMDFSRFITTLMTSSESDGTTPTRNSTTTFEKTTLFENKFKLTEETTSSVSHFENSLKTSDSEIVNQHFTKMADSTTTTTTAGGTGITTNITLATPLFDNKATLSTSGISVTTVDPISVEYTTATPTYVTLSTVNSNDRSEFDHTTSDVITTFDNTETLNVFTTVPTESEDNTKHTSASKQISNTNLRTVTKGEFPTNTNGSEIPSYYTTMYPSYTNTPGYNSPNITETKTVSTSQFDETSANTNDLPISTIHITKTSGDTESLINTISEGMTTTDHETQNSPSSFPEYQNSSNTINNISKYATSSSILTEQHTTRPSLPWNTTYKELTSIADRPSTTKYSTLSFLDNANNTEYTTSEHVTVTAGYPVGTSVKPYDNTRFEYTTLPTDRGDSFYTNTVPRSEFITSTTDRFNVSQELNYSQDSSSTVSISKTSAEITVNMKTSPEYTSSTNLNIVTDTGTGRRDATTMSNNSTVEEPSTTDYTITAVLATDSKPTTKESLETPINTIPSNITSKTFTSGITTDLHDLTTSANGISSNYEISTITKAISSLLPTNGNITSGQKTNIPETYISTGVTSNPSKSVTTTDTSTLTTSAIDITTYTETSTDTDNIDISLTTDETITNGQTTDTNETTISSNIASRVILSRTTTYTQDHAESSNDITTNSEISTVTDTTNSLLVTDDTTVNETSSNSPITTNSFTLTSKAVTDRTTTATPGLAVSTSDITTNSEISALTETINSLSITDDTTTTGTFSNTMVTTTPFILATNPFNVTSKAVTDRTTISTPGLAVSTNYNTTDSEISTGTGTTNSVVSTDDMITAGQVNDSPKTMSASEITSTNNELTSTDAIMTTTAHNSSSSITLDEITNTRSSTNAMQLSLETTSTTYTKFQGTSFITRTFNYTTTTPIGASSIKAVTVTSSYSRNDPTTGLSTHLIYNNYRSYSFTTTPKKFASLAPTVTICPKEIDSRNTQWFETQPGISIFIPCASKNIELTGNISRQCSAEGTWTLPTYKCVRMEVTEIQNTISKIDDRPPTDTDVEHALQRLSKLTAPEQMNVSLYTGEIHAITAILENILNLDNLEVTHDKSGAFLETASNLLDTRNADSWQAFENSQDVTGASKLLDIISAYSDIVGQALNEDESLSETTINTPNILLQVRKINGSLGVTFPENGKYRHFDSKATLQLPADSLKGSTLFSAVVYRNLSGVVSTKATYNSYKNVLGSSVMSVKLNNWRSNNDFKIIITFEHVKAFDMKAVCSFRSDKSTIWENEGCFAKSSNSTTTVCECSHLTNFAILMSPWTENNVESKAIRVITIAGCSVSTAGLVATILLHFYFWRYLKSDRVKILMNLCIALVISYVIFIGGVDRTENKDLCTTVAVLLHYIYLVVFFLMLGEGIEIAFSVLHVFATKSRLKWILPASWVVPGLIVGISLAVTWIKGYGNKQSCWLSFDNGLIWAFVGPALTILLINIVLLCFVLRAIFKVKIILNKQKLKKAITGIRCLCILLPLLGCTWIIGIFYVNKSMSWIQYVFSICNGAQGLVIFIFHCALNKQVKKAYVTKQKQSETASLTKSKPAVSKLHFIPRMTTHISSSALYSINSGPGTETSNIRIREMQENGIDLDYHVKMKRYRHIDAYYEEECTRL